MIDRGGGPAPSHVDGRSVPSLLAFAAYTALTIAMMWPILAHLSSALPHDVVDPVLNTWILWWNAHAIPLTAEWRNAPMFWPMRGSLLLSEHLVGVAVVTTPMQWAGLSPVTAYNLAWLWSFPLCAIAAHALAHAIVNRHDTAAIAGLVFGFNPYRIAHAAHLQTLWAFWIPIALLGLHRYVAERRRMWLAVFALAWLMEALTSGYYLLFLPVLLACWILWFTIGRSPTTAAAIVSAWVAASLPLIPFVWAHLQTHDALSLERRISEIEAFSADASGIATASADSIVWRWLANGSGQESAMFPGALALALIIGAVGVAAWRSIRGSGGRERDRGVLRLMRIVLPWLTAIVTVVGLSPLVVGPWQIAPRGVLLLSVYSIEKPMSIALLLAAASLLTSRSFGRWWRNRSALAFYVLAAVLSYLLSLGPHARLGGTPVLFHAPYFWLLKLPGFSSARAPARFGMLFVVCVACAAALAFARATRGLSRRTQYGLAAAACLVIVAESWSAIAVAALPRSIGALAGTDANVPVLELPLGDGERDVAAVYRSIQHRRSVVNGYSGYVPLSYGVLRASLRLDDGAALTELARERGLTVAIDRREQFARWAAVVESCHGVLVADAGDWRVYRVRAAEREPVPAFGGSLAIASVTANTRADSVSLMLDTDPLTAWSSGRPQAGGEAVMIDLGTDRTVDAVRLMLTAFVDDFPRRLEIDCAAEHGEWRPCWAGSTSGLALRAVLADARAAPLTIPIGLERVRRIRLSQTDRDPVNAWSIGELAVLGR
jgi:hypothetical protein